MISTFRAIPEFFKILHLLEKAYEQPQVVDLKKDFASFAFNTHYPEKQAAVKELFDKHVVDAGGKQKYVKSLLSTSVYHLGDEDFFKQMGFRHLNLDPSTGIVIEHDELEGWLIKKNYGWIENGDKKKRVTKAVLFRDVPKWMLPTRSDKPQKQVLGIEVPNETLNPLRVATLKRGRRWIKDLQCTHLKAAREYLVFLPQVANQKPLHEQVVVLSKKENLLSETESFKRLTLLAEENPLQLQQIASEVCRFLCCNPITDLHLRNMRFLADQSDTLFFMDGEPVGGLAEASNSEAVRANQRFDRGFFSIVSLKKLQGSITPMMKEEYLNASSIAKVQKIFDEAVETHVQVVIWQRKWQSLKNHVDRYTLIYTVITVTLLALLALKLAS